MKKIFLALLTFAFFGIAENAMGQCSPLATTPDTVGLYPKSLPDGMVGVPYDEQIDFVMFQDTTIVLFGSATTLWACTFELMDITTKPTNTTYTSVTVTPGGPTYASGSNPPKWVVNHAPGSINKGCVRLTGTPTAPIVDDSIRIKVRISPTNADPASSGGNCSPVALLTQTVTYALHWHIAPFNAIGDAMSAKQINLKVVPNPAQGKSAISMNLKSKSEVAIAVYDMMGREVANVYNGVATEGAQSYTVDTDNLNNGIYIVKVTLDGKTSIADKFVVQN